MRGEKEGRKNTDMKGGGEGRHEMLREKQRRREGGKLINPLRKKCICFI